ncbi:MAG: HI0074 family nucleotidyltransferase substrate-binding subunit [Legionellaceae bacterium]|nr:HI0074 family nucleotidyltransferase substrate-binding subunit [Legionellaceae bacterium]
MPIELDLNSFKNAHSELIDAFKYYNSTLAKHDANLQRHLRGGTIQAFEFTYELAIKFVRRYLELTEPSRETVSAMTFPSLIRTANEKGLLSSDIELWKQFREKRNITSHTYDGSKAEEVMTIIPDFIRYCASLLNELQKRVHDA